ncbi:MAG: hypothetical protein KF784_15895 [Fimbriimonadaceae bacterium]|nr:hypothetical protein [Fimbriimonadaceae bacterium]
MNLKCITSSLIAGAVLTILVGCGGTPQNLEVSSGSRGDGSIPIGRAHGTIGKPIEVTVKFEDGSKYTVSPEPSGNVSLPSSIPPGEWIVEVTQTVEEYPVVFTTQPKSQKMNIFDITLLPARSRADVTGVTLGLGPVVEMSVGSVLKLKPIISGSNVQGLSPSYWTSGGIGKITPGGLFKATETGTGTVTVDVEGYRDSVTINVQ